MQSPGTPDSQPDRAGAERRTASGVMAAHPAEDGFPRSETFEQTVIPAQAGINVQSPGTPDSQPDRAGAERRTASGVMAAHPAEDRFPRSETFEQTVIPAQAGIHVQSPGTPDSQPDRAGAERRTASGVMAAHPAEDGSPRSETFEQTVIPAQAGIQVRGFPGRNASHLRHAVSHRGSYAKVYVRGNDGGWGKRATTILVEWHSQRYVIHSPVAPDAATA